MEESSYEPSSSPVEALAGGEVWEIQVKKRLISSLSCFNFFNFSFCQCLSWRGDIWSVEEKSHLSAQLGSGSRKVPGMERPNAWRGFSGCWFQPLRSLSRLGWSPGGSSECGQERTGRGGGTVQRLLQVGMQQEWDQLSMLNLRTLKHFTMMFCLWSTHRCTTGDLLNQIWCIYFKNLFFLTPVNIK